MTSCSRVRFWTQRDQLLLRSVSPKAQTDSDGSAVDGETPTMLWRSVRCPVKAGGCLAHLGSARCSLSHSQPQHDRHKAPKRPLAPTHCEHDYLSGTRYAFTLYDTDSPQNSIFRRLRYGDSVPPQTSLVGSEHLSSTGLLGGGYSGGSQEQRKPHPGSGGHSGHGAHC